MEKKEFTLTLALVDALPVLFFGGAAAMLGVKLQSALFIVGAALCLLAGAGKVAWKVLLALKGKDVAILGAQLRQLAEAMAGQCGGVAAVLSGEKGSFHVCLACPGGDVNDLGNAMAEALNGRGGGKTGFYQGTLQADREEIEDFFNRQFS